MNVTTWSVYDTAHSAWEAMCRAIESAETSVLFEQYLFQDFEKEGSVGKRFLDLFRKKAGEGCDVVLIFDAIGSNDLYRNDSARKSLKDAGVKVLFNKLHTSFITRGLPPLHVNHRKLLIVDSRTAFTGGVVFGDMFRDWADTMVCVSGGIVDPLIDAFRTMEAHLEGGEHLREVLDEVDDGFDVRLQRPGVAHRDIYRSLLSQISLAKHHIRIATPYFSPPESFVERLIDASKRGVKVEIILPDKTEYAAVTAVNKSYVSRLLRHGIRVYFYKPFSLHAKFVSIDTEWVSIGSMNLDFLSTWLNYELNIESRDKAFAEDINELFETYQKQSMKITLEEWSARSWREKMIHHGAKILRKFT